MPGGTADERRDESDSPCESVGGLLIKLCRCLSKQKELGHNSTLTIKLAFGLPNVSL